MPAAPTKGLIERMRAAQARGAPDAAERRALERRLREDAARAATEPGR